MYVQVTIEYQYCVDGDVLNLWYIINKDFFEEAYIRLNPACAMQLSRNDGKFDNDVNHTKDLLINLTTMVHLSRKYYTDEQRNQIEKLKEMA